MKKLKVNEEACIGCGACAAICSEVFDLNDDGLAHVIIEEVPEELIEDAMDAKESCPTEAIVEDDDNDTEGAVVEDDTEDEPLD